MSSRLRAALAALTCVAALLHPSGAASAQRVRVHATDAVTGAPVSAVVAMLIDDAGRRVAAALGGDDGTVVLSVGTAGRFRLRVERTGYAAWTAAEALALTPATATTLEIRAPLTERRGALEAMIVRSTASCERGIGAASREAVAALWEEAGKALLATAVAEQERRVAVRVRTAERRLSVGGYVMHDSVLPSRVVTGRPYVTLPAESLNAGGWVRRAGPALEYFAPDAEVLLSPAFADTHCFDTVHGEGADAGLIGLTFAPASGVALAEPLPDVRGTLWLEARTSQLRRVDFDFVNLPAPEGRGTVELPPEQNARGRAEFGQLEDGSWIVRRWWLRVPVLTRWKQGFALPGRRAQYWAGEFRERLGESVPLGEGADDTPAAVVSGVAYDSSASEPLVDAVVSLGGHRTRTDSTGRFRIAAWLPGTYEVRVRHPRLIAAGVGDLGGTLPLVTGDSLTLTAAIPAPTSLLATQCPTSGAGSLVAGVVLDRAGAPLDAAVVRLWLPGTTAIPRGARASASEQGVVIQTTADAAGRFRICGVPPTTRGVLRIETDTGAERELNVSVPDQGVLLVTPPAPADTGASDTPPRHLQRSSEVMPASVPVLRARAPH